MLKTTLEAYADSLFADRNGQARLTALKGTVELANLIPPTVSYESRGNVVIIGAEAEIVALAPQFSALNSVTLLATEVAETPERRGNADSDTLNRNNVYFANAPRVKGYLGAFDVECDIQGEVLAANLAKVAIGRECFDLVVDLTPTGVIASEIPPPGYYAIGAGKADLAQVVEDLPDMMGTFDKPKYFRLNTDLCAHSSRGVEGCDRCLDACPAGALSSTGHSIEINPYLCQGVGTCATACPTEAIQYALPEAEKTQHFVYQLLANYRQAGGESPVLMLYGLRDEAAVSKRLETLPTCVLPVALEELATVGIDTWFSALVYGAHQVLLATHTAFIPPTIDRVLAHELQTAHAFLTAMGYDEKRLDLFDLNDQSPYAGFNAPLLTHNPATDSALDGSKRDKLFAALDALYAIAPEQPATSSVPATAPYGSVTCQTDDCTLCMSCVAVCPTRALHAIGDRPGLLFVEQDCVQCGLCEKACPEKVISLAPGMNWDADARQASRLIHEEEAACCITCGKAFAPASMVKMLTEKLQGHSHFQGEAIRRLSMCEDCRVRDIFSTIVDDPESQLRV